VKVIKLKKHQLNKLFYILSYTIDQLRGRGPRNRLFRDSAKAGIN